MLNINNYLKENQGEVVNAVGMAVAIPVAVTNLLEHIPNSKLASQIDLFKASKAYRSLGVCGMMVAAYHSAKSLDHLYSCWEQNIENKQLATDLLTVGSSAFTAINIALPVFFPEARIFQPSLRLAAFVVFDLGGLAAASYEGASSSDLLVNALLTAVFNCGKSDVAELKAGVKQAASFSSSLVHARHRAFDATEALDAEHSYLQEPQGWTISRSKDKNRAPTGIFGEQASAAERGFFGISLGGHIHRKGTPLIPSADDIRLVAGESAMRRTDVSFETGGWLPDGQRYVVTVSSKYDHKSGVSLSIEDPDNKLWKYFACELQEIHQQLGEIQNQTNDALVRNDEAKLAALSDREAAADRIETQLPAINRDNDIKQFFAAFLKLIHLMEKLPSAVESDPFTMHPIEGELAHGFAQDLLAIVGKLGQGIEIAKPKGSKRYSFATTICQCLNERNLDR